MGLALVLQGAGLMVQAWLPANTTVPKTLFDGVTKELVVVISIWRFEIVRVTRADPGIIEDKLGLRWTNVRISTVQILWFFSQ